MPLVVSTVSWTIMNFMDRVFLKWDSGSAMSAAFSASVSWFAMLCLPLGICAYVSTFVSQYHGDRQPEHIGPIIWQGVGIALLATPFVLAAIPLAPLLFGLAEHDAETMQKEIQYFQILCVGGPGFLIAQSLSSLYSGRGRTYVLMGVDTLCSLVNMVLDYIWIFGYAGFPKMGIVGAGWATVFALWLKAAIYIVLILRQHNRLHFSTLAGMKPNWPLLGRLVYYGGPSGVQMLLDVLGFTVFVMMVGRLGHLESEATTMAFSISTLAFMPMWGFGMTTSILVGQRLGDNRDDLAAQATWTSLQVAMIYMVLISAMFVLVPELFLYGFFAGSEAPPAEQAALRTMAVNLLRFVAAYNVLDAMLMIFVSAIKGAGDTRFVLNVSLVMGLLLAGLSWLVIEVFHWGVYRSWCIITAWVWIMGIVYLLRFLQGKWRSMRVIEMREEVVTSEIAPDDVDGPLDLAMQTEP